MLLILLLSTLIHHVVCTLMQSLISCPNFTPIPWLVHAGCHEQDGQQAARGRASDAHAEC